MGRGVGRTPSRRDEEGNMDDTEIGQAGNALGQAIADAMLEVFDGLMNGVAEE